MIGPGVYLVAPAEGWPVKIGMSSLDVAPRIAAARHRYIPKGRAAQVRVVLTPEAVASDLESWLHLEFRDYRFGMWELFFVTIDEAEAEARRWYRILVPPPGALL